MNTSALLDALEPLDGTTALDFACGTGVTTAWLAERGAQVLALDASLAAVMHAQRLCDELGLSPSFYCGQLADLAHRTPAFQRILGRFALHHVDLDEAAPILGNLLHPTGSAAFLETMSTNPLLDVARRTLPGRFHIPRFGTPDESPLGRQDLQTLRAAFGYLHLDLKQMVFLRILDRQVFGYRHHTITKLCSWVDDALCAHPTSHFLSYQRILILRHAAPYPI